MSNKGPEIEFVNLNHLAQKKDHCQGNPALESLKKLANSALKKGPFSVTSEKKPPHIAASGDPRDFLSYAPYWWPENQNGKNVYVKRDGKRNPDIKDVKDQQQLEHFGNNLTYLALAFFFFNDEKYVNHAANLARTFFVDDRTKMNPHVNYGQVVRGEGNPSGMGRGEGIMSTRMLARIANVLPLLANHPSFRDLNGPIHNWFSDYLNWLITSEIGRQELNMPNNHHTWAVVQLATIQYYLGRQDDARRTVEDFFAHTAPRQVADNGDQPLESARTKPFHYLIFNLHAMVFLAELGAALNCNSYEAAHRAIERATDYAIKKGREEPAPKNEDRDLVQGVRSVQLVSNHHGDDGRFASYVQASQQSPAAASYSGDKRAIVELWSR
ncbi:putative alginate lyase [Umbelopsis sp. PMI_123]|nr:putative alginate lyase [Umbelopsis sp. PMI_123]